MRYRPELHRAVSLAKLVIEFELESPQVQPIPTSWRNDLRAAKGELARLQEALERRRVESK